MAKRSLLVVLLALLWSVYVKAQTADLDAEYRLYNAEAVWFREQCRLAGDKGLQWFRYHSFGDVYRIELPCEMFTKYGGSDGDAIILVDEQARQAVQSGRRAQADEVGVVDVPDVPAKAEESGMSVTQSPAGILGAQPTPAAQIAAVQTVVKESKWHSVLEHVKAFFGIALKDVVKYTPEAAKLAEVIFPQYVGAIETEKAILVGAATTVQNAVLTVEQKYSDAAKGDATNKAKLEDAVAIASPVVVSALQQLKVPVPATVTDVENKIEATVAILKNWTVPVSTPSATGT